MVKSYLKYEHAKSFGSILSGSSNLIWTSKDRTGTGAGQAITAANEEVLCWDLKKGELINRWKDERCSYTATAIAQSGVDKDMFAVGYEDGSIRIWDSKIATVLVNFNGHKSAITHLVFDKSGGDLQVVQRTLTSLFGIWLQKLACTSFEDTKIRSRE